MTVRAPARGMVFLLALVSTNLCLAESSKARSFLLSGFPPVISASCPQFPALNGPGVLCEDFDTERNGVPGFQFTRLPRTTDPSDPLRAIGDANDDVLGYTQTGAPSPIGTAGRVCSNGRGLGRLGCDGVVQEENDWHLHSPFEGPGAGYDPRNLPGIGAPDGGKAHSGFRSMHWGRHLNFDTPATGDGTDIRYRQIAAYVMDSQGPPNLPGLVIGPSTTLEFWHIVKVCNDDNCGAGFLPPGGTFGGGQVQLSLMGAGGKFEKWQTLTGSFNGYGNVINSTISICEFDPGDDQQPPTDDTMCQVAAPLWADIGSTTGTDPTCTTDTTGTDPSHKDCGRISSCSGGPGCAELGSRGTGVWVKSGFDLSPFAGRVARLRWIGSEGGGWSFGITRSALETYPGTPVYQYHETDDGWFLDDIVLTDLREGPDPCGVDADGDGFLACADDCDDHHATVYPGAPELCDGLLNDCNDPAWPFTASPDNVDDDGDGYAECQGDCNDASPAAHPGGIEVCDNLDNDCDGTTDEGFDQDGDHVTTCMGDCDDLHASVYPNAPQICDGLNNNCRASNWPSLTGTNEADGDHDGFTGCQGDCNDGNMAVHPGVVEICDVLDNDCDGLTDEGFDQDGDGYKTCSGDCDDAHRSVYPGAPQICDGLNNNCLSNTWPALTNTNEDDYDHDGFTVCSGDCNDSYNYAWSKPGEVRELTLAGGVQASLGWQPPLVTGGLDYYDVIRSGSRSDFFTGATCVLIHSLETQVIDGVTPNAGAAFYYLVRAETLCPPGNNQGPLGFSSNGVQHNGMSCF